LVVCLQVVVAAMMEFETEYLLVPYRPWLVAANKDLQTLLVGLVAAADEDQVVQSNNYRP